MADKPGVPAEWHPDEIRDVAERWGLPEANPFAQVLEAVTRKVLKWLESDRRALFQNLYRLDVSEAKVQEVLRNGGLDEQARAIAELILRRELQKARTRRESKPPGTP